VTWRLRQGLPDLAPEERSAVMETIRGRSGVDYELYAWVVMNDHVHVVFRPLGDKAMDKIMQAWKSISVNRIQKLGLREGAVWQSESFDRIVRDEDELYEKCNYVLDNPRRRWPDVVDYPWIGFS
jgi:putative transposase